MNKIKYALMVVGLTVGFSAVAAGISIKCDNCTCDMNTGICECTGCTIEIQ